MFLGDKHPQRQAGKEKRRDDCDDYQIVVGPGLIAKDHERKHHHVGDDQETVAHECDCKDEESGSAE